MLEEVLNHLHNRFVRNSKCGKFTIADGALEIIGLQHGQYFWINGSVFNDGLHRWPTTGKDCYPLPAMQDEEFKGTVQFLAVPQAVIEIADEIEAWCENNAQVLDGPYQSESFDGYSYTKASGGSESGEAVETWQSHFRNRLNVWRKVA
ncbi:MAG: hypothetical protein IJ111_01230 [Eggerthellaceae bacterium]|nr:hypothetical protein [Eggerthellaceae bacterium]